MSQNYSEDLIGKVSIVLPTYNGAKYIKQSIDSCLKQTYSNLELIIVDDGSSNEISQIIKSYSDPRIKYFKHKRNLGLAQALNTGFAHAKGEYLTWISDDNFYLPEAVECMVKELEANPKVDFIYANYYVINEKGKLLRSARVGLIKNLDRHNCIGPCFLYRRKIYEKIGEYNPEFYLAEDYNYWLRVREKFQMQRLGEYLCYYRLHKKSLTSQYNLAKIEEQAQKASEKYVSQSMRFYRLGRVSFYKREYGKAEKMLIKSISLSPFNLQSWKLSIFIILKILFPSLANKIKRTNN